MPCPRSLPPAHHRFMVCQNAQRSPMRGRPGAMSGPGADAGRPGGRNEPCSKCGKWSGNSLRQAELPANSREARVATKRRHFRVPQKECPTRCGTDDSRAVQRLERAIFVPQRGIDHRQTERLVMRGGQSFRLPRGGRPGHTRGPSKPIALRMYIGRAHGRRSVVVSGRGLTRG